MKGGHRDHLSPLAFTCHHRPVIGAWPPAREEYDATARRAVSTTLTREEGVAAAGRAAVGVHRRLASLRLPALCVLSTTVFRLLVPDSAPHYLFVAPILGCARAEGNQEHAGGHLNVVS
jgi:hypothetical protein